ncbi:hypothetical protein GCM10009839_21940 [Catenulispora yoronensis]|uniref:WD40-like Beta Propeller Repeat n=1 Tax=Catenulispora yoronensis TaxID=450799 RepID=A0ABP5FEL3_9ACTN
MAARSHRLAAAVLSTALTLAAGALAAGPAHATAQGDNGVVAFLTHIGNQYRIAVAHADGSGYKVLNLAAQGMAATPNLATPAMSPDGTRIAFAESGGSSAIWTANVDGSHLVRVSSPTASMSDSAPAWAPDSSRIYFARTVGAGQTQIFSVFADGGDDRSLFGGATGFSDTTPDVAPNGDVAFARTNGPDAGIYVRSAISGLAVLFARDGRDPSYSPLGTLLAYAGPVPFAGTGIYYRPATGGSETFVQGTGFGSHPSWSPDGFKIAYQATPSGAAGLHLHVVDVNSDTISDVTTNAGAGTPEFSPSWQPVTSVGIDRVGGPDRIDTAIATSRLGYDNAGLGGSQAGGAVLTRSDSFADALAGSALAAKLHAPLLLTATGALDQRVAGELRRVLKPGAQVTLLGGTDVMSQHVADQVAALGFTTRRLEGPDRYGTAAAIASAISPNPTRILVATGNNFPDALAAGAATGTGVRVGKDTVVLLSDDRSLPEATAAYLRTHVTATTELYGIGDQGVAALRTMFPTDKVHVVAGPDRFATAAAVARTFFTGPTAPHITGLAVGYNWPDALAGGALLGAHGAPLLLADHAAIPGVEADYAQTESASVNEILAFGGTDVVPDAAAFRLGDLVGIAGHRSYFVNRLAPPLP